MKERWAEVGKSVSIKFKGGGVFEEGAFLLMVLQHVFQGVLELEEFIKWIKFDGGSATLTFALILILGVLSKPT